MPARRATAAVLLLLTLVFGGCGLLGTTADEDRATAVARTAAVRDKTVEAEANYVATQVAPADGGAVVKPAGGKPAGARETAVAAINTVASGPQAGPTDPTQGGCSATGGRPTTLHIVFRGVEPGEKFEGEITQPPPEGVSGDPTFETTAGPDGVARVDVGIKGGGSIAWVGYTMGRFINGYFFAFRCAGPPP